MSRIGWHRGRPLPLPSNKHDFESLLHRYFKLAYFSLAGSLLASPPPRRPKALRLRRLWQGIPVQRQTEHPQNEQAHQGEALPMQVGYSDDWPRWWWWWMCSGSHDLWQLTGLNNGNTKERIFECHLLTGYQSTVLYVSCGLKKTLCGSF